MLQLNGEESRNDAIFRSMAYIDSSTPEWYTPCSPNDLNIAIRFRRFCVFSCRIHVFAQHLAISIRTVLSHLLRAGPVAMLHQR